MIETSIARLFSSAEISGIDPVVGTVRKIGAQKKADDCIVVRPSISE